MIISKFNHTRQVYLEGITKMKLTYVNFVTKIITFLIIPKIMKLLIFLNIIEILLNLTFIIFHKTRRILNMKYIKTENY